MALILSIETATTNCSVSLSFKGETLFLKEDYGLNYSHAERLHLYIDEVLKEAKYTLKDVDAIAVSKGPGSYTGLRIGVSAVKGLCYSLNKPLLSVSTLEHLAHQVKVDYGYIIPLLDARRMEVYTTVFDCNHKEIKPIEAKVVDATSFSDFLTKGSVTFIGNGAKKVNDVIAHQNAHFILDKLPSANEMSMLAFKKYSHGDFEDVAYFEPFYLKDFVALTKKK